MKISKSTMILKAVRELSTCKHIPREMVIGCIKSLKHNYNYECDTSEEELTDEIIRVMREIECNTICAYKFT